jgi:hypothetical protein
MRQCCFPSSVVNLEMISFCFGFGFLVAICFGYFPPAWLVSSFRLPFTSTALWIFKMKVILCLGSKGWRLGERKVGGWWDSSTFDSVGVIMHGCQLHVGILMSKQRQAHCDAYQPTYASDLIHTTKGLIVDRRS